MATTVFNTEEIVLLDGKTKLTLKPNSIAVQRKFMQEFNTEMDPKDPDIIDKTYDRMVKLTQICLTGIDKELAEDTEKIEELFDEQTIYKIIEVCGGIELNSPKMQAAMEALAEELGTN